MSHSYNGVFARNILYENEISKILGDEEKVGEMRENIKKGDTYIVKNVLPKKKILDIQKNVLILPSIKDLFRSYFSYLSY